MVLCNCWCKSVVVKVAHSVAGLFNNIIIWSIFISVNAFKKFYCVNLFLSSMAMTSVCQKSICIYQDCRNKGFMFTIIDVWDQVCSPENQFFNISSCKWPSTSSLKSFTWFWRCIDQLPIYFFIPSTCPAHDVTNFIDCDWFRQCFWPLFDLKLLIFKPL